MEPYHQIFPDSADPDLNLVLERKSGGIPKGTYRFTESYCTDAADCRKVVVVVLNEKGKQKAVISFGFDQDGPFAGPYLDTSSAQSPYASQLLDFFVDALNSSPDYLSLLYRHYREVRGKVDGKPYRGKPFPNPGELVYRATPPPDLEAEMLESLKKLRAGGRPSQPRLSVAPATRGVPRPAGVTGPPAKEKPGIAAFVKRYAEAGTAGAIDVVMTLQDDLRRYLLQDEDAAAEPARYLKELWRQSPHDDASKNAALRLLYDALNLLKEQIGMERPPAQERMDELQEALAEEVFGENGDVDLRVAVANILMQSRVEMGAGLGKRATGILVEGGGAHDLPVDEITAGISRSLESMGVASPFEGAREIMQLLTGTEPEVQGAILGELLKAEKPLLRDISPLMLFSGERDVRVATSRMLASVEGNQISPETLRRLIVARNWLEQDLRRNVDRAVTNARKARVDCAPLPRPASMTVYATSIDGRGDQLLEIMVPHGNAFSRCTLLLRDGEGVADASVVPLKGKGAVNDLLRSLKQDPKFIDSSPEHLDLRICHALADGARSGRTPSLWLLRIAELLGRDRWKPISFDPSRELLQLWEELESVQPKLLDEEACAASFEESGKWELSGSFLPSWDDDEEAAKLVEQAGDRREPEAAVEVILDEVLEQRRGVWLERLVVTALLLKSCSKPPIPWHRMFHVAQAVADDTLPLRQIPLMVRIARESAGKRTPRSNKSS